MLIKLKNVDVLDILRVSATLFVFLLHGRSYITGIDNAKIFGIVTCFPAWGGVWIFIFLSGYLFGKNMKQNRYSILCNNRFIVSNLIKFYISRIAKLAPLYIIYLLLYDLFNNGKLIIDNFPIFLKMIFFVFNGNNGFVGIGHLWYVSIAVQLYVFMPFIFLILNSATKGDTKRLFVSMFVTVALGYIWRYMGKRMEVNWYTWIYTFCISNIDIITCGIICAFLQPKLKVQNRDKGFALSLFIFLIFYNMFIYSKSIYDIYMYIMPTVYILILSFLVITWDKNQSNRNGIISKMSKYSYAFYIFHIACMEYIVTYLVKKRWYNNLNIYGRYAIFFMLTFIITIFFSIIFTDHFKFNFRRKHEKNN